MNAPRDLGELQAVLRAATLGLGEAELQQAAKAEGRTVAAVACDRMRARYADELADLKDPDRLASGAWRLTPVMVREVLLIMGAQHPHPETAALRPWASLDEATRRAVGAYARWLRRGLDHAGALR